jgi:hypothetical protein
VGKLDLALLLQPVLLHPLYPCPQHFLGPVFLMPVSYLENLSLSLTCVEVFLHLCRWNCFILVAVEQKHRNTSGKLSELFQIVYVENIEGQFFLYQRFDEI